jgi:ribonuclease HII
MCEDNAELGQLRQSGYPSDFRTVEIEIEAMLTLTIVRRRFPCFVTNVCKVD